MPGYGIPKNPLIKPKRIKIMNAEYKMNIVFYKR